MALRLRVSSSAIGSVCDIIPFTGCLYRMYSPSGLPAGFDNAGQLAVERVLAQAEPAHLEAPIIRARASAQRAAVILPHLEFLFAGRFHPETSLSHRLLVL